jgi:membrane protein YqaA with SNARE-associated domain
MSNEINLETGFYEYGLKEKRKDLFILILISLFIFLTFYTIFFLSKNYFGFLDNILKNIYNHITINFDIKNLTATTLGMFYTTLFGGLFFLMVPIEGIFFGALNNPNNNQFILLFLALLGITISFICNYYVGYKFSEPMKKIISIKQFYKLKSKINKQGNILVFLINVIPFMPSPFLSFTLGVFRYNKIRASLLIFSGKFIKFVSIIIFVYLIKYII